MENARRKPIDEFYPDGGYGDLEYDPATGCFVYLSCGDCLFGVCVVGLKPVGQTLTAEAKAKASSSVTINRRCLCRPG